MLFFVVSMKVDFFLPNKNKFQKENDFETTRAHCCKQINGWLAWIVWWINWKKGTSLKLDDTVLIRGQFSSLDYMIHTLLDLTINTLWCVLYRDDSRLKV